MILTFRLDWQISFISSGNWDTCWSCPRSRTFGYASWPCALRSSDTPFSPRRPFLVSLCSDFTFHTHAAMLFQISLPSSPDGLNLPLSRAPTLHSHIAQSFSSFRLDPSSPPRRQAPSRQQSNRLFNSPSLSQTTLSSCNFGGMFGPPKLAHSAATFRNVLC
jgi:hypothetical protein